MGRKNDFHQISDNNFIISKNFLRSFLILQVGLRIGLPVSDYSDRLV